MREISKTEKIISEEDKQAIELARTLAKERKDFKILVIDIASFKGKMRARLKGVKITPTIIIGNNRIVGVPRKEEFEALLKH
jgi:protein-disulfide isomerase